MKIIKKKDHYLFKNELGEYHLSIEKYKELGEENAIKFVEGEIKKKIKSIYKDVDIDFERASDLGFCDFGIEDFCKELKLDINKTYKISYLRSEVEKNLRLLFKYINECLKLFGKEVFEKNEEAISKNAHHSYYYANYVLEGRFEKGEEAISKYANHSYWYAKDVLKGKFELGEEVISKNAHHSYYYANYVLEGRFEKGEEAISKDSHYSCCYAKDVLKNNE